MNEVDPYSDDSRLTLEEINEDMPTFLVHDYASEDMEGWLEHYYQVAPVGAPCMLGFVAIIVSW